MIVDFQSDGNTWDSSASNSTRTFSSGDDDIPLLTVDKSEYRAKNVNNALSNQFHDLVVGEIASAHLDTLQTVFEGFPQNKAMEEGFNHKSRDEIAVNSTSNIMPQLDEFISKFLNIALDDAVSLSCKNYGEDFVIKKSSEEEDNDKKEEEENEEEDEEDKLSIIDQEITINEKTEEEKKPNILKSIKSYFTKSKENETKIKNNSSISSNDSSSWLPKTNMKRSNTVSPKSNSIFLNSEDDKNEANEEQSGKKTIFKSLPFFKSKNADNNEGTNNEDEKAQSSFAKTQSSPKILLQKLFSPKSKEISNSNNNKTQHTVRFSDLDENNDRFSEQVDIIENNSYDSFQVNSQPNNDSILNDENKNQLQNSKPVLVENLEDFSSATDSDSPRCHTPNSNPNISNNHLFDILEEEEEDNEEQGSDEEMVKSLIRPPTPEKEIKEQFSSDSDAKKKNPDPKDISFDSDSSSKHEAKQKHTITSKSGNIQIDISFDSDSSKKTEKKPSGSSIKKDISVDIVTTTKSETINEPGSPNSQKSGRSNKDQDLLLSESDSESVDKIKNKFAASQANKKGKSNFMAFHLSSSSSEPDTQKQDHLSVKKSEDKQIEVNAKSNDNQKSKIDNDNNKNSLNEGETIKTVLSNVEFIANELSDFELDHENLESEEDQKSSQNKTAQNSVKLKIKNYRKTVKKLKEEEDTEITNTEKKRKVTKRIMSKSSQTLREVPLKRRPNIIQENQSYEIYEGRAGNSNNNDRKRIKKRKIDLPFEKEEEDDDEDEEEMNKKRRKKIRRRKISPSNGKSSNSSSPHSKSSSPTSSPIHTHTHTPVPVKPRLILKNDSSSDDEENTLTKPKKVTPIKKKRRSGSITPKSRRSPISSSPTTTTKTETFSSSPPQNKSKNEVVHSPVIRRRKSSLQAKTIGDSNAFFNDDDRFNVSIKINNQQNKTSPNLQSDVAAKPRQQVARRKRRAASESAPLRIKTTATSKNNSDDDDDSLTVKRKKKTLSRESLLNDDQIRITENLSGPISRIVMDNSEGQAHNRIRTFNQKRKRRLSVDEAVINHKTLAKNGVRSIIVIEFDKKTPIIENFLEQISSNSGAFSQSAAPRSRPSSRCRRTAQTSDDGEFDQNESSGNKTKPKIKKQVKPKISNRQKKKVALSNNLSDEENNNNNDEDNVAVDFSSSSKMKDKRKRRQESVKPSSANRSSGPQRRNSNLNGGGERLTKTINKEIITESENLVIHNPIKPNSRSGRRNASVRSNMGSRKYDDENDDRHYKFNFKKLFDEAEKMQNNKE